MTLVPKHPPGRANRKALQFAYDIHRLRNDGYTFSAIRTALLDAGLSVSLSTVKREAARRVTLSMQTQRGFTTEGPSSAPMANAANVDANLAEVPEPPRTAGHAIAEAFFTAHPSNPLLRSKEFP